MTYGPIILTAADEKFKELIRPWEAQVKKMHYRCIICDLGGLGTGRPYQNSQPIVTKYDDSLPETAKVKVGKTMKTNRKALGNFKPKCLLDMMEQTHSWEWMMWLDADAFIAKPIGELFHGVHDVAVTIRHKEASKPSSRFLNSGVVVVRNTSNAHRFVEQWVREQEKPDCQHDQSALHNVFYNWDFPLKPVYAGRSFNVNSILVKCLPWRTYNRTFTSLDRFETIVLEDHAKIWHMQKGYFEETADTRQALFRELSRV